MYRNIKLLKYKIIDYSFLARTKLFVACSKEFLYLPSFSAAFSLFLIEVMFTASTLPTISKLECPV